MASRLPAGVLYFPARIERVSVRDRLAQAEIEKERRKQLRRSGVLLNSDPVLDAMEPCGGSPRFLPYTLDKEGRKTGDLASFAQLAQLERFVFQTVAALGDRAGGRPHRPRSLHPRCKGQRLCVLPLF